MATRTRFTRPKRVFVTNLDAKKVCPDPGKLLKLHELRGK